MKKAKIFLSAFTVLALVGGALAFNAKHSTVYCASSTGQTAGSSSCPAKTSSTYALNELGASYCTITNNTTCSERSDAPVKDN